MLVVIGKKRQNFCFCIKYEYLLVLLIFQDSKLNVCLGCLVRQNKSINVHVERLAVITIDYYMKLNDNARLIVVFITNLLL